MFRILLIEFLACFKNALYRFTFYTPLLIGLITQLQAESPFDATRHLPVSYQGRFRALEPASELWLYDTYHSTRLKKNDQKAFSTATPSALELLWKMHFFGHSPWVDSPFFWIHYAELKSLLNLPLDQDRFSYTSLSKQLYSDRTTNLATLRPLLAYEYASSYMSAANRLKNKKIELSNLADGLWLSLHNHTLKVTAAPSSHPWSFLTPGMKLVENFDPAIAAKQHKRTSEELLQLLQELQQFTAMQGSKQIDKEFKETFQRLKYQGVASNDIARTLEARHPLSTRLQQTGNTLKMLPGRHSEGEWLSLHALKLQVYNPQTKELTYAGNFTVFQDDLFESLRSAYLQMEAAARQFYFPKKSANAHAETILNESIQRFSNLLQTGYDSIAGQPFKKAAGKTLSYPSTLQLEAEAAYHRIPLVGTAIACYSIGLLMLVLHAFLHHRPLLFWALGVLSGAFAFHSAALALRVFILERPPVSNMFETVLYVPWIAMVMGFVFFERSRHYLILAAAATASLVLLVLLKLTHVDSRMENVQAVLDSQYWLSVHVLMVVGCYGIFAVCGILGHFYLIAASRSGPHTATAQLLAKSILHTMYIGIALLIPGTILGGVWAAESWGRFWDWDPKESWAFISACVYVLVIHAYTFRYIKDFGLAVGSIAGLLAISFTWYGVNYILGTGLHSYGFGKGGEGYYFLYLIAEIAFLAGTTTLYQRRQVN